MTLLYFLILLSVIICIHEAGHLIAAKIFGVYCYEYSMGMGPLLLKRQKGETQYSLRALPIGGFVAMAGENDGSEAYPDVVVPEGRRLNEAALWKRIIILCAGVFMNFILAFLLFSLVNLMYGYYAESPEPVIGSLVEGHPAEKAGLQPGDRIVQLSSDTSQMIPESYMDIQVFLSENEGAVITVTAERWDEQHVFTIEPEYLEEEGRYVIGITSAEPEVIEVTLANCWKYGFMDMQSSSKLLVRTLRRLLRGRGLNQLSGPVGFYNATEVYASYGLASYLFLMAELSLNVGIFNLLPLPVLDGGQIVINAGEAIAGRKLSTRAKTIIIGICWVLLISLMLYITFQDILRLVIGG